MPVLPSHRRLGRGVAALRQRLRWRQADLAGRAGVSQQTVSRIEAGRLHGVPLTLLETVAAALDAHLAIELRASGEAVMTDAVHAALQDWLVGWLQTVGWVTRTEVSFNHFGDRGRVDVLAYRDEPRVVVVAEIKTRLQDAQDTVGRLDVKRRVGRLLAREMGWRADLVVPALVFLDGRTARRRVGEHRFLFERFSLRGRRARAWLRQPSRSVPSGLLFFVALPGTRQAGVRRVRPGRACQSGAPHSRQG
jgi:transcriptional regulator with XRE-family HTH domain